MKTKNNKHTYGMFLFCFIYISTKFDIIWKKFGYSKSTIHNDVSYRLEKIDPVLYIETKKILDEHFADKHIRGGESTRRKYLEQE